MNTHYYSLLPKRENKSNGSLAILWNQFPLIKDFKNWVLKSKSNPTKTIITLLKQLLNIWTVSFGANTEFVLYIGTFKVNLIDYTLPNRNNNIYHHHNDDMIIL